MQIALLAWCVLILWRLAAWLSPELNKSRYVTWETTAYVLLYSPYLLRVIFDGIDISGGVYTITKFFVHVLMPTFSCFCMVLFDGESGKMPILVSSLHRFWVFMSLFLSIFSTCVFKQVVIFKLLVVVIQLVSSMLALLVTKTWRFSWVDIGFIVGSAAM